MPEVAAGVPGASGVGNQHPAGNSNVAPPTLTPEQLAVMKFKVKGPDGEEEVDYNTLISERQLAKLSSKKARESSELYDKMQAAIKKGKTDPRGLLKEFGLDPAEFARSVLEENANEHLLTDDEKAKRSLETRADKAERELKEQRDNAKKEADTREEAIHAKKLDDDLAVVLKKYKFKPEVAAVYASKIGQKMLEFYNMGWKDVTVGDVDPYVQRDIRDENWNFVRNAEDKDGLLGMIPDDVLEILGQLASKKMVQGKNIPKRVSKETNKQSAQKTGKKTEGDKPQFINPRDAHDAYMERLEAKRQKGR